MKKKTVQKRKLQVNVATVRDLGSKDLDATAGASIGLNTAACTQNAHSYKCTTSQ